MATDPETPFAATVGSLEASMFRDGKDAQYV
jgi:hypothetical protein